MTRRLAAAVFLLATLVVPAAHAQGSFDKKLPEDRQILHALNRLTFGPRQADVEEVRRVGLEKWIELQLHPDQIPENPIAELRLQPLETLRMIPQDITTKYQANVMMISGLGAVSATTTGNITIVRAVNGGGLDTPPVRQQASAEIRRATLMSQNPPQLISRDLQEGKLFRALYSNRQLEEVLVDFWFNHFNVDEAKPSVRNLLSSYERDVIRPHVLGKFKDMLLATSWHPAMLHYLDNWQSMAPEAHRPGPGQTVMLHGTSRGLNENYGRELLELHTLGVDGGYTQQDVIAAALAFTGWTVRSPSEPVYRYVDFAHHKGDMTFLGHTLRGSEGIQNGADVIDILARHPSTARFISQELAKRFVSDNPPQSLVDRMASTFTATEGDLRAVLETMFRSTEFLSEGAWRSKVKSPLEMVVSAVRALGAETTDAYALSRWIGEMGQPLYNKPEPTGYPNASDAWLNTAGLLSRIKFASALSSGKIEGVTLDQSQFDGKDTSAIGRMVLGSDLPVETRNAISNGMQGQQAAGGFIEGMILASPDFQRR